MYTGSEAGREVALRGRREEEWLEWSRGPHLGHPKRVQPRLCTPSESEISGLRDVLQNRDGPGIFHLQERRECVAPYDGIGVIELA